MLMALITLGLNLKFEAKSQKVLGYSQKSAHGWEFSEKTLQLLQEYRNLFPEIVQTLMDRPREDLRDASQFFGSNAPAKMKQLKEWIKAKGVRDLEAVPLFAEQLSKDTVKGIEDFMTKINAQSSLRRVMLRGIPRSALLKPAHAPYRLTAQHYNLGDRVICVADTGMVPITSRGVVVGINSTSLDVVFDSPFLSGSNLDGRCSAYKGAIVGFSTLLNLSQPQYMCKEQGASTEVTNGAATASPAVYPSALERTLKNGNSNGHAGSAAANGAYRPPSTFKAAPTRGGAAPVSVMRRDGAANGKQHDTTIPFSHVTSGQARPRPPPASGAAGVNPHLAALNLNGNASGSRGGRGGIGASRGSARGRGMPSRGRGGGLSVNQ